MFWAGISGGVPEGEPAGFSGGVMPGVPPPIPPKVARVVPVWAVAAARVVLPVARVRRTLKGMMQQPAEKPGGKHSFLKTV